MPRGLPAHRLRPARGLLVHHEGAALFAVEELGFVLDPHLVRGGCRRTRSSTVRRDRRNAASAVERHRVPRRRMYRAEWAERPGPVCPWPVANAGRPAAPGVRCHRYGCGPAPAVTRGGEFRSGATPVTGRVAPVTASSRRSRSRQDRGVVPAPPAVPAPGSPHGQGVLPAKCCPARSTLSTTVPLKAARPPSGGRQHLVQRRRAPVKKSPGGHTSSREWILFSVAGSVFSFQRSVKTLLFRTRTLTESRGICSQ